MTPPMAAVKAGFRQYLHFSGRAARPEFWWWMLFIGIVGIVLSFGVGIVGATAGMDYFLLSALFGLFGVATLLSGLAITSRRLHDIGKSGWWQLTWYTIPTLAWLLAIGLVYIGLTAFFAAYAADDWQPDAAAIGLESPAGFPLSFLLLMMSPVFTMPAAATLWTPIWAVIWLARPGEPAANRYGPAPGAASADGTALPGPADWYTGYNR